MGLFSTPTEVGGATLFSPEIDTSDFTKAAHVLLEMSEYIGNYQGQLQAAKEIARQDMADRFDNMIDPAGERWRDLTDSYKDEKSKKYPLYPILTASGYTGNPNSLRVKATRESAWSVAGDSVFFSTEDLPYYWRGHERGREGSTVDEYATVDGKKYKTGFTTSAGGAMPQRRFIGLSDQAEDEIIAMMEGWMGTVFVGAEQEYKAEGGGIFDIGASYKGGILTESLPGGGGKLQYRVKGAGFGGRFGPRA